jgi:hypothetical protein
MSPEITGVQARLADFKAFHLAIECAGIRDRTRFVTRQDWSLMSGILQDWERSGTSGTQECGNEYQKAQKASTFHQ